ncbi:MAG: phosphoribosylformylglycinamidine cyclo-ligase [Candidatus Kerfeldbacteria bacterium]|nr:phosphoribosylformylglycinamidine cyclo-ligase [Candidatus Kerfeldbacteria bacterium]
MAVTYKESGVDVEVGDEAIRRIIPLVKKSFNHRVLTGLGLFGSLYEITDLVKQYKEPVLVQSIDGVGTKMAIAGMMGMYAQAGRDMVAHSCNDVLCQGAKPLTLLDYVATAKLDPAILAEIVGGMAEECAKYGMSLVGGETAEMPGTYVEGEWDLAGSVLGVVEKSKIIDGSKIQVGDALIGLSSDGLHTNGYSLARKVFFDLKKFSVRDVVAEMPQSVGAMLMKPHKNYTNYVLPLLEKYQVHGLAHITGGGLIKNIPRILPEGCTAQIQKGSWEILPVFEAIQQFGDVPEKDMYITMNMGIGMVVVVPAAERDAVMADLKKHSDLNTYTIGEVVAGKREVCFV